MRDVLVGDAAAAVHAGQIVNAVLAFRAHALGDELTRFEHARDFFVGAGKDSAARVAHDGIERIAETVGAGRSGG